MLMTDAQKAAAIVVHAEGESNLYLAFTDPDGTVSLVNEEDHMFIVAPDGAVISDYYVAPPEWPYEQMLPNALDVGV
jgi:hypothetical protein